MSCNLGNMGTNKVCIEVKKVFDVCIRRLQLANVPLTVIYSDTPTFPVVVQSIASNGEGVVSNVAITPIPGSLCSRVAYTLALPVSVTVTDAVGNTYVGTSTYSLTQSVQLRFPDEGALVPTQFEASSVLTGIALSSSETTIVANICILVINKVVAEVILAIPTYGYPKLKVCADETNFLCPGFEDRNIFPTV